MSMLAWYILIPMITLMYFILTYLWMQHTFHYKNTLNYYAFKRELESNKRSFMHYVEVAVTILLLIGLLTTFVSQIQIWVSKRGK